MSVQNPKELTSNIKLLPDQTEHWRMRQAASQDAYRAAMMKFNAYRQQQALDKELETQVSAIAKLDYSKVAGEADRKEIIADVEKVTDSAANMIRKARQTGGLLTWGDRIELEKQVQDVKHKIDLGEFNSNKYVEHIQNMRVSFGNEKVDSSGTTMNFVKGWQNNMAPDKTIKDRYNFLSNFQPTGIPSTYNPNTVFEKGKGGMEIIPKRVKTGDNTYELRYDYEGTRDQVKNQLTIGNTSIVGKKAELETATGRTWTDDEFSDYQAKVGQSLFATQYRGGEGVNVNIGTGNESPAPPPPAGDASEFKFTLPFYTIKYDRAGGNERSFTIKTPEEFKGKIGLIVPQTVISFTNNGGSLDVSNGEMIGKTETIGPVKTQQLVYLPVDAKGRPTNGKHFPYSNPMSTVPFIYGTAKRPGQGNEDRPVLIRATANNLQTLFTNAGEGDQKKYMINQLDFYAFDTRGNQLDINDGLKKATPAELNEFWKLLENGTYRVSMKKAPPKKKR